MDATPLPLGLWRPEGCDRLALVFQGGGALGAYQAGVYEALHKAGLEPDWVTGVSIGGINAALIAGNPPTCRLDRLREFWDTVTSWPIGCLPQIGDHARKQRDLWSSFLTVMRGVPGFFDVNFPNPWLSARGAPTATSYYDTAPLRETLLRLIDFDLLNAGATRFAAGAVNIASGNFNYFDNASSVIIPEHVMASGALPPGLPMVRVGTDWYWDGGLVSNTPLQHLLDNVGGSNTMVFQVDLFSARGPVPREMAEVLARQKDIQYSSRTRLTTDNYMRLHAMKLQIRSLLSRVPGSSLTAEDRKTITELAHIPSLNIIQMIYQQAPYEGEAKDYEFSAASMSEHWDSGRRDTERTLRRKDWLLMPPDNGGLVVHDIHRIDD